MVDLPVLRGPYQPVLQGQRTDGIGSWCMQKQQALLGQMLMEGYGCERDPEAGKEWADKAKRRGYRMEGVYCRI